MRKKRRQRRLHSSRNPPAKKLNSETFPAMEGYLKMHREGYGFVLSDDPRKPDVFIPSRHMAGAMEGDRVLCSVSRNTRDGRLEGLIVKIIRRGTQWVVGEFKRIRNQDLVQVEEKGRVMEFFIPPPKTMGAKPGENVGIRILKYPEKTEPGTGEVIRLFSNRGEEKTEIDILILEHQLPTEFPDAVVREAKSLQDNPTVDLSEGRKDLRSLPLVTIDGEQAKDFDDAISVTQERNGYRLWVSIADVSHYVRPGSALDQEAFKRGTSVYFPGRVLPMLPEELSNDLCSLRPLEDRLSFTAELWIDSQGKVQESQFYRSLIRSQGRLTYKQVARAVISGEAEAQKPLQNVLEMLKQALTLAKLLRWKRFSRGSIDFDLPEPEIILNLEEGNTEKIVKAERNEAHFMIEEFMIAANEAVATHITQKRWPTLYRVHADPDPEKVENFHRLLHNLGFSIAFPKRPDSKFFNRVLGEIRGHPEEPLIQHMLLRTMKQAVYSQENLGHFGLASDCYTHFTSPIRRYPDLVVHRILAQTLSGTRNPVGRAWEAQNNTLAQWAGHTSRRERVAMEAEWEAVALKVALFMKQYVGQSFTGVVSRIAKFGFFVELKEFFVEGLVRLENLEDDYYLFDEKNHRLRGRRSGRIYKIGTELKVLVSKVDVEQREVLFSPI